MSQAIQAPDEIVDHEKTEELLDHAEENITALILGTVAYLKSKQLPPADWVHFIGEHVAPTWEEVQGQGARSVARLIAINVVVAGGDIDALDGDDQRAELRCRWLDDEDLELFDLTRKDVEAVVEVYQPIMATLGLNYAVQREGDRVTMTISR